MFEGRDGAKAPGFEAFHASTAHTSPLLYDIDLDGVPDIVLATYDGEILFFKDTVSSFIWVWGSGCWLLPDIVLPPCDGTPFKDTVGYWFGFGFDSVVLGCDHSCRSCWGQSNLRDRATCLCEPAST